MGVSSRMSPEAELYPEWQDGCPLWRGETSRRHCYWQYLDQRVCVKESQKEYPSCWQERLRSPGNMSCVQMSSPSPASTVLILIIKSPDAPEYSYLVNLQSLLTNNQRWPLRVRKMQSYVGLCSLQSNQTPVQMVF